MVLRLKQQPEHLEEETQTHKLLCTMTGIVTWHSPLVRLTRMNKSLSTSTMLMFVTKKLLLLQNPAVKFQAVK
jgi:hypothetical protein